MGASSIMIPPLTKKEDSKNSTAIKTAIGKAIIDAAAAQSSVWMNVGALAMM